MLKSLAFNLEMKQIQPSHVLLVFYRVISEVAPPGCHGKPHFNRNLGNNSQGLCDTVCFILWKFPM